MIVPLFLFRYAKSIIVIVMVVIVLLAIKGVLVLLWGLNSYHVIIVVQRKRERMNSM